MPKLLKSAFQFRLFALPQYGIIAAKRFTGQAKGAVGYGGLPGRKIWVCILKEALPAGKAESRPQQTGPVTGEATGLRERRYDEAIRIWH